MRPFPGEKLQPLPHRVRHDQDVGKQDRPVEPEPPQRLNRDLGGGLAVIDELEKAALVRTKFPIFRQIAPGLTHQPHGRHRLAVTFERVEKRTGHRAP